MKRELSLALLIASTCVLAAPPNAGPVGGAMTIDRHGKQIASIFSGISPNPRIAHAFARIMEERRENRAFQVPSTCRAGLKKVSYHPRLKKVCGYPCVSHYQTLVPRDPTFCADCGGGNEFWTNFDPNAPYCIGYQDQVGEACNGHCNDQVTCDIPNCTPTG